MKYVSPATVFAAIVAGTFLSAMSLTAESAVVYATNAAAESKYRNAVAECDRMKGSAARRCMRAARAARDAAEIEARDASGVARHIDLIVRPATEDATGDAGREPRTPGGGTPTFWILPDVKGVPDNLAGNAAR